MTRIEENDLSPEALFLQANTLKAQGLYEQAAKNYERILELQPGLATVHNNLGNTYYALGKYSQALQSLMKALELAPDFPEAHFNAGCQLLLHGDLAGGWEEFEWRWKTDLYASQRLPSPQPKWDGSAQLKSTLLLHSEQGFGDSIQFVRYASWARKLVGKIILCCQDELIPLFEGVEGVDRLIAKTETIPQHEIQVSLLSLPYLAKTTLDSIPAKAPYLTVSPQHQLTWKRRLNLDNAFRIAFVWQGNPQHAKDSMRCAPLERFLPLLKTPRTRWFSLQKGLQEKNQLHPNVFELGPQLKDFSDTAAAISQMDLVISVDTACAHLAGALGKPVWLLLPFSPDWRWMLNREDSPWYPSMKLFRQPNTGDWDSVFAKVHRGLLELPR